MLLRRIALVVGAASALSLLLANSGPPAEAQGADGAAALAGQVASTEEGPMEGVIVSAKKDGSNITVSVITNAQGRYSFPAARLAPGRYGLQIRAVGYDLEGPKNADVAAGQPAGSQRRRLLSLFSLGFSLGWRILRSRGTGRPERRQHGWRARAYWHLPKRCHRIAEHIRIVGWTRPS